MTIDHVTLKLSDMIDYVTLKVEWKLCIKSLDQWLYAEFPATVFTLFNILAGLSNSDESGLVSIVQEEYSGDVNLLLVQKGDFVPIISYQTNLEEKAKLLAESLCKALKIKEITLDIEEGKEYEPLWNRLYANLKNWKKEKKQNATLQALQQALNVIGLKGKIKESESYCNKFNTAEDVHFIPVLQEVLKLEERGKIEQLSKELMKLTIKEEKSTGEQVLPSLYKKPTCQLLEEVLNSWIERSNDSIETFLNALKNSGYPDDICSKIYESKKVS